MEPAQLVFELGHTGMEAFQNFAHINRQNNAVRAMMTRGIVALDRIFEFFPADAAGAKALAGGDFFHGREFNLKSKARNPLPVQIVIQFAI